MISGLRRPLGDDGEIDVAVDQEGGIDQLATDLAGQGGPGRPAPMLAATSAMVTGLGKERMEPSGSLMSGMLAGLRQKVRSSRTFQQTNGCKLDYDF